VIEVIMTMVSVMMVTAMVVMTMPNTCVYGVGF